MTPTPDPLVAALHSVHSPQPQNAGHEFADRYEAEKVRAALAKEGVVLVSRDSLRELLLDDFIEGSPSDTWTQAGVYEYITEKLEQIGEHSDAR